MTGYEKQINKYKNKRAIRKILSLLSLLLIVAGLLILFFNPIIEKVMVPHAIHKANEVVKDVSPEQIMNNEERISKLLNGVNSSNYGDISSVDKNISYNPDNVRAIDRVPTGQSINTNYLMGKLYIPSVGLNIAVLEGISNENLNVASGTMKPGQIMGKRNYAIAGHNMLRSGVLFTPILDVSEYDSIYLSNKSMVYEYVVTKKYVVNQNEVNVIEDSEAKDSQSIITLTTCYNPDVNGHTVKRLVVRGALVKKYSINKASHDVREGIMN